MKIFFISIHVEKTPPAFPLASVILKTALRNDKRTEKAAIELRELYLPTDAEAAAAELVRDGKDSAGCVFCFSVYTWNAAETIAICRVLRRLSPEILLLAGGPQVTASAGDFHETGLFDCLVRGEGETEIANAVSALVGSGKREKLLTDAAPADFRHSPSPYTDSSEDTPGPDGILWEISRGCPYNCAFCYESRGQGKIRRITPKRIRKELEIFRNAGIEKIWVLDPTFNHDRKHAEMVLDLITGIYPEAHYTFEIRAERMTEKICSLLSGLNASLQIGLQSINPVALKNINRSLSREVFLQKCGLMAEYGLTFGIDLIYGLPGDDYRSFRDSLDFAVGAAPNNIDIFPLSVLPGTALAENAGTLKIVHKGFPTYETIETASFGKSDMKKAAELTEAADLLYNREQSFAWLSTAAAVLDLSPSEMFESFGKHRNNDVLDFIRTELKRRKRTEFTAAITSFIRWSRAAEEAFANPGKAYRVRLIHHPETLDKLAGCRPDDFLRRHPEKKERDYYIVFDGDELYIKSK